MNLYEVVCFGPPDPMDDSDMIYLVRASDYRSASDEVQLNASPSNHGGRPPNPHTVYELGSEQTRMVETAPRIMRGPYRQCAYNYGWRAWHRRIEGANFTNEWQEEGPGD